jgi:hypothetical protein
MNLSMTIRLEREDSLPAFGAFLRCEEQHTDNQVILINVAACMDPAPETEDGDTAEMNRDDRRRLLITTMMHEFGQPVNEQAIEEACEAWETAYGADE